VFDDITLVAIKRTDEEMVNLKERSLAVGHAGVS
jgi:hypothetical protein